MMVDVKNKQPSVSGILNNCLLDCALPMIFKRVGELARKEADEDLPTVREDSHFAAMSHLKTLFARHYAIDEASFSWQQFANAIQSVSHTDELGVNFLEMQLMFAPVLRQFVAYNMQAAEIPDAEISRLTEIQDNGRYQVLEPAQGFDYFFEPLGINLTVRHDREEIQPALNLDRVDDPVGHVTVHLNTADMHYELSRENHGKDNPYRSEQTGAFERAFTSCISRDQTLEQFEAIKRDMQGRFVQRDVMQVAEQQVEDVPLTAAEERVLAATSSTQADTEKVEKYQKNIKGLLAQRRAGFFDNLPNRIDIKNENIDEAEALPGETDDEYAKRLQDAELRKGFGSG